MGINKKEKAIDIYDFWATNGNMIELKKWCEHQIELGRVEFTVNVDWGYYSDISAIHMEAVQPKKKIKK